MWISLSQYPTTQFSERTLFAIIITSINLSPNYWVSFFLHPMISCNELSLTLYCLWCRRETSYLKYECVVRYFDVDVDRCVGEWLENSLKEWQPTVTVLRSTEHNTRGKVHRHHLFQARQLRVVQLCQTWCTLTLQTATAAQSNSALPNVVHANVRLQQQLRVVRFAKRGAR